MSIFKKRREIIVDENDVTTVISNINRRCGLYDFSIGNAVWKDMPDRWFIAFNVYDSEYGKIMKSLIEIGDIKVDVRPGGKVDLYFIKGA